MPLMERFATAANLEVAHLAFDTSRVEAAATADAAAAGNLVEHRVAPGFESLRGERPRLAASCV
jgi:hypothetical protein